MKVPSDLLKRYEQLYAKLKSEEILEYLERFPQDVRRELIDMIQRIPHPKLASVWDVMDVCNQISSGKLEYLFQFRSLGQESREIYHYIRELYPELIERRLPPIPEIPKEPTIKDVTYMLNWTARTLSAIHALSCYTASMTDIILKGQCPFCGGDLVEVVVDNELRLRCRNQTHYNCKNWEWLIGIAKKVKRP